jgi:broad specificity phosphatase PhoE
MELLLIRHGEPARDSADRADPGLSERGARQAARLAEYLLDEHLDALYTSPLRRAAETAAVLGNALGLHPEVRDDLAEFDRDAAEYLHFEDLAVNDDPRYHAFLREDLSAWGTDVETFRARVQSEFEHLIAAHPGQRVAVVSHGGVANAYLGGLVGADRLIIHDPGYTGFARIQASRSGFRELVSMNETPHLRGHDLGIRAVVKGAR